MKIYILTCINESSELVSCKPYKTELLAQADMLCELNNEADDLAKRGHLGYQKINDRSASVGDEEYCYIWNITEGEI